MANLLGFDFVMPLVINAFDTMQRDWCSPAAVARMTRNRLQARIIELLVAEADQIRIARAIVHVKVALVNIQTKRGAEQVFDLALMGFEKFLIAFGFIVVAGGD